MVSKKPWNFNTLDRDNPNNFLRQVKPIFADINLIISTKTIFRLPIFYFRKFLAFSILESICKNALRKDAFSAIVETIYWQCNKLGSISEMFSLGLKSSIMISGDKQIFTYFVNLSSKCLKVSVVKRRRFELLQQLF